MYCQRDIEGESKCQNQCEHCKVYFAPLEGKPELTHHEKLVLSNATDLRDNHTIEKDGYYIKIKPIDPNKKFRL